MTAAAWSGLSSDDLGVVAFRSLSLPRLGQYRPITVIRFVVTGTIEDRLLKLQEKKLLVFESTVGRSTEALTRLTAEDLAFLFQ